MRTTYKLLVIAIMAIVSAGCDDYLDTASDTQKQVSQSFRSIEDLRGATAHLYSQTWFGFMGQRYYQLGDGLANNIITDNPNGELSQMGRRTFNSGIAGLSAAWNSLYVVITQADYIVNDYANITRQYVSEGDVNACEGEARFMRGLAYWYLVTFWHDVPIIDNPTDYTVSTVTPPHRYEDVLQYAIHDLEYAVQWLPETAYATGRLTKHSAQAQLARLYLDAAAYARGGHFTSEYLQRNGASGQPALAETYYAKAMAATRDVIDNGSQYALLEDYEDLFKVQNNNNRECLLSWQIVPGIDTYGLGNSNQNNLGHNNTMQGGLNAWGGSTFVSFDIVLLSQNDKGLSRWRGTFFSYGHKYNYLGTQTAEGSYTYTGTKCNVKKQITGSSEDTGGIAINGNSGLMTPMIRLADVYLMHAEACMGTGDEITDDSEGALTCYNKVRERAFHLNPYDFEERTHLTRDQLFVERRLEFCFEGLSKADIKRRSFYDMEWALKYMSNGFGEEAQANGTLNECMMPYFIAKHYTWNGDDTGFTNSPRGDFDYQTAVHSVPSGSYVHSMDAQDNVWSIFYPEVEVGNDPLLTAAPISYDFGTENR